MIKEPFFIEVAKAEHIHDYILKLYFNNNQIRYFNFAWIYNDGEGLKKLKNMKFFLNFTIDYTINWEDDKLGIAPEFFYCCGTKTLQEVENKTQEEFEKTRNYTYIEETM